jgi:polysaccharide export outer membrane protein
MLLAALAAIGLVAGCQTDSAKMAAITAQTGSTNEAISLREGDMLKISFPGSPTLDTSQQIRRDGKITLPLVGEVDAAGMTPSALEKKLADLYAPQLVSKQVTVELLNSSFPIYVTGMVLRPGKILSDHPITALETIMEAGGFDFTRANLRGVSVIRREGNTMKHYTLNLKSVLQGKQNEMFYMQPGDIIYVPERFTMF